MLPKKVKNLLPLVADKNDYPLDLVEAINTFFWESTRKVLGEAPEIKIHIANLGDFNIKHWLLDEKEQKYTQMLTRVQNRKFPNQFIIENIQEKLTIIRNLKEFKLQEDQKKGFVKAHKERLKNAKNIEANLAE